MFPAGKSPEALAGSLSFLDVSFLDASAFLSSVLVVTFGVSGFFADEELEPDPVLVPVPVVPSVVPVPVVLSVPVLVPVPVVPVVPVPVECESVSDPESEVEVPEPVEEPVDEPV